MPTLVKELYQLRHTMKEKAPGADGKTHITAEGREFARLLGVAQQQDAFLQDVPNIDVMFVGVEPRLSETADAFQEGLGYQPRRVGPIVEIGGDEWAYSNAYTKEMQARKAVAGVTWFQALIMFHGVEQVARWTEEIAMVGIKKMLDQIDARECGLAFGHFPDMGQLAAWGYAGFPKLDDLRGGAEHVEELGGYRYSQYDNGDVTVKRVNRPFTYEAAVKLFG